jgi:ABC-type transport system involved in Fe-S cluster assembly fused permease/ATPase subunit
MRIYWPPDVVVDEEKPGILVVSSKQWERSRICEVPQARALLPHRGLIAIAHRLATLRNFDRVVMLKAGKIIEDGSPDRLMQGRGPYRELVTQEMRRLATHAA